MVLSIKGFMVVLPRLFGLRLNTSDVGISTLHVDIEL